MQPKQVWLKDGKLQTYTNHWEEVNVGPTPEPVAVTWVSLDSNSLTLSINETHKLNATISPSDATDKKVTWSSSDSAVASVSKTWSVKWLSVGTATITVTTHDGNYTDSCEVRVTDGQYEVQSIEISGEPESLFWYVGRRDWQWVKITPYTASNVRFSVTSSDENVARITDIYYDEQPSEWSVGSFTVEYVSEWTCSITLVSEDNPSATATYLLTVYPDIPVVSIDNLSSSTGTVYKGMTAYNIVSLDYSPTNAVRPSEDIHVRLKDWETNIWYGWIQSNWIGTAELAFRVDDNAQLWDSAVYEIYIEGSEELPLEVTLTVAEPITEVNAGSYSWGLNMEVWETSSQAFEYLPSAWDIDSLNVYSNDGGVCTVNSVTGSAWEWAINVTAVWEWRCDIIIMWANTSTLNVVPVSVTAHQSTPISSLSNLSASSVSVAAWDMDSSITIDYLPVDADDDTNVEFIPVDDSIAAASFVGMVQPWTATIGVEWLSAGSTRINIYLDNVDTGLYIDVTVTSAIIPSSFSNLSQWASAEDMVQLVEEQTATVTVDYLPVDANDFSWITFLPESQSAIIVSGAITSYNSGTATITLTSVSGYWGDTTVSMLQNWEPTWIVIYVYVEENCYD